MTPLQIEMLLHIHCRVEPYNDRGGAAARRSARRSSYSTATT